MTVRNACVARGEVPTVGWTVVYTVPSNFVLLLKSILLENGGSNPLTARIRLAPLGTSLNVQLGGQSIQGNATLVLSNWLALNGGDQIIVDTNGLPTKYWISGALLPYWVGPATNLD